MQKRYLNEGNIPLPLAVMLVTDNYDYSDTGISATSLIRSTRSLILGSRVPEEDAVIDISTLVRSSIGHAVHDALESAWKNNHAQAMKDLGYPQKVIDRVRIDPETKEEGVLPVHLEKRMFREIDGKTISGKYDMVIDGNLYDYKTTSVWAYMKDTKASDNKMQGSIYRWLNPERITGDFIEVIYILLDWSAARTYEPGYPQESSVSVKYPLLSLQETENFIRNKLAELERYKNADEKDIPLCTPEELWQSEPTWKYYKNPEKRSRSTKNFTNKLDAYQRLHEDNSVGVVVEVPGEAKKCKYCKAFPICSQKDQLIADGTLKL